MRIKFISISSYCDVSFSLLVRYLYLQGEVILASVRVSESRSALPCRDGQAVLVIRRRVRGEVVLQIRDHLVDRHPVRVQERVIIAPAAAQPKHTHHVRSGSVTNKLSHALSHGQLVYALDFVAMFLRQHNTLAKRAISVERWTRRRNESLQERERRCFSFTPFALENDMQRCDC